MPVEKTDSEPSSSALVTLLPGDGIGPEVVDATQRVLDAVASRYGFVLRYESAVMGGAAIDACGQPLPDETLAACLQANAVLLGAVGGPAWSDPRAKVRPEQGLLALRKAMGLFANLRPVEVDPCMLEASPLKAERLKGVDMLIVRELTSGLYFGESGRKGTSGTGEERAFDTLDYSRDEVQRVVALAFRLAKGRRGKVTSVDKANVLESSRLWREVAEEVANDSALDNAGVELEHQLVDSCAMRLLSDPASFDVLVTGNMFGDILSDEAAVLPGSLGLMPSASLGESTGARGSKGLYEPIHGSAPDIAGKGWANPLGTIRSAALLLRYSLGQDAAATAIEEACRRALALGARTRDLGGSLGSHEMTNAVLECLPANPEA